MRAAVRLCDDAVSIKNRRRRELEPRRRAARDEVRAAAALAGGATTLITTLIALHEEAGTSTLLFEQCQLTPQQTAIIRNLLEFDEDSCSGLYNISLDRILETG